MELLIYNKSIRKFTQSLREDIQGKVDHMFHLLREYNGNIGGRYTKKISKDIFELRIHMDFQVRYLYTFYKGTIMILHGFVKKTQKIPKKELIIARNRKMSLD